MGYRNGIFATIAFALTSVALAGVVYTDAYSSAAQSEANGLHALTEQVLRGDDAEVCEVSVPTLLSADSTAAASASATVQR
jgi:hypothetical protein